MWDILLSDICANVCPQLVSESGVEQEVVVPHNEPVMAALEDYCKKVMTPRHWKQ